MTYGAVNEKLWAFSLLTPIAGIPLVCSHEYSLILLISLSLKNSYASKTTIEPSETV
ncbi:MAG TPA: hypothetical protein VFG90_10535 [Nitrososphaeraceae archaeon]|nr:hypothetical protein [Nitrososphaeraceae archaeon]